MDVIINVALWFVIVKIFNHIDPIDEGLYKGSNNLVYLAKSLPLTLAFYPIGAYFSHCLLMLNCDCLYQWKRHIHGKRTQSF